MNTNSFVRLSLFSVGCAVGVLFAGPASARVYTITPTGTCTLALAIQAVNTQTNQGSCLAGTGTEQLVPGIFGDVINLASGTFTASALHIQKNVAIRGAGVGTTTLRSNVTSASDFITVHPSANQTRAYFENLSVVKGANQTSPSVAGIYVFSLGANTASLNVKSCRIAGHTWSGLYSLDSSMTVEDSTIENNSSGESGGGIHIHSTQPAVGGLIIDRTTINNNTSPDFGGGIYFAGNAAAQIRNTTISGNSAVHGGGVAYDSSDTTNAYFNLINTTVTQNSASAFGGGIYTPVGSGYDANFGTVATIVANNSAQFSPDWEGHLHATTSSLVGDTTGMVFPEPGNEQGTNLYDVDPSLDPVLRSWGGPTKTHRLMPGSAALDVVDPLDTSQDMDQRKVKRPQLGGLDANMVDMGAYEESRLEAEIMQEANKTPGVPHVTVSHVNYSNGQGKNLQATADNQFVTYGTPSATPNGTYKLVVGFKKGTNGGRFRVATGEAVVGPFTNIGSLQNGLAPSNSWTSVDLGSVTFSGGGLKFVRFTVIDTLGSGRHVFPDFMELTKQ